MTDEPVVDLYDRHNDRAVVRLALQGHRSAAMELVRRGGAQTTLTRFLKAFLTSDELSHLSARQFTTLDDAFQEQWQAANRETVPLAAVKSNL